MLRFYEQSTIYDQVGLCDWPVIGTLVFAKASLLHSIPLIDGMSLKLL